MPKIVENSWKRGSIVIRKNFVKKKRKAKDKEVLDMQLLTIRLNEVKFGIPIEAVQSIEERLQTVGVPHSLPYIKGIMNLHGNIIPVYSLAEKFGYPDQDISNIVVTNVNNTLIGFEVNRVEEILEVSDENVAPMPGIISSQEDFMTKVVHYNKQLIVLLNVNQLIAADEQLNIQKMLEETTMNV